MSSDADVRYSANISLSAHSKVPMECLPINTSQFVCETVTKPDTPFPQGTLGIAVSLGILVIVFAVMGGFSAVFRALGNLRSKR